MTEISSALGWIDWLVVALYFLVSTVGGLIFAGGQKSPDDYFVGGRNLPGWAIGLSLFATSISTSTFMTFPGQGYSGDMTRLLSHLMLPIAAVFIILVVVPFYRHVVNISAYEYLERRFGYPARVYAALMFILTQSFRMGFVLFLAHTAIHSLTGWPLVECIVVGGVVTVGYTMVGGVRADVWTDVIQSFVMFGGAIMCLLILLYEPAGGPFELMNVASEAGKFKLADMQLDLTQATFLVLILQGLFQYSDGYSTGQSAVQRYLCTATTKQAQIAVVVGAFNCVFMWCLFMFIGTMLFSYYKLYPDQLPAEVAASPLNVFPHFLATRLPTGVLGLFLAALCAAGMSTLSTTVNSLSLTSMQDFYSRLRPGLTDKQSVRASKIAACIWGVIAIVTALAMRDVKAALDVSIAAFSILTGGMFGMFLLAFFVKRAHAAGVYVGLVAGATVSLWAAIDQLEQFGLQDSFPVHIFLTGAVSNIVSFVVGYAASLLLPDLSMKDPTGLLVWDLWSKPTASTQPRFMQSEAS